MTLAPGTSIGPYEINGFVGAGAMGEVYRARDARLGREVAIKVLPAQFSADRERLRRFDQEARTAGTLNHRNILAIHDVGSHDGMPYVVSELLQGDTLRGRLAGGALPLRKALDYGVQIAEGLAAAQARGVIHRDLKPENLFVTGDGTVKILDFGLAKLIERGTNGTTPAASDSLAGTMTGVGLIMGTVGYMAPEQARGQVADHASDVFALGCVLYEMVTGVRAFHRASPMDTLAAILNEDPPPFPAKLRAESPGLVAVILRCMEKASSERFESARDLAFSLRVLGGAEPGGQIPAAAADGVPVDRSVAYKRLTFRRGWIQRARFTPDGNAVVYGGSWEGAPVETFWLHLGHHEGRSVANPGTDVFSVSRGGDLAVCIKRRFRTGFITAGTLARQPLGGGAPRQLMQAVEEADWSPDGTALAIVREVNGMNRLEFPIGRVLFETQGWISHPRIARDGKRIAFIHHVYQNNDGGDVAVVDLEGKMTVLSADWGTVRGLAWSPDDREVWFTAHPEGAGRNLSGVTLDGVVRPLLQVPGQLCIQDTFPDGRVLLTHSVERQVIMVKPPGESDERDLSWMDWSLVRDISADGQWILLVESGEGGGALGAICIRPTDGSPAVHLGEGNPFQFSPDGAWVLASTSVPGYPGKLTILPTGVGEPRDVPTGTLACRYAQWMPDGKSVVVAATDGDRPLRLYRVDLGDPPSVPVPIGPDGPVTTQFFISPDGRWLVVRAGDLPTMLYPVAGGEPMAIPTLRPDDEIQAWTMEAGAMLVSTAGEMPARLFRIDLETGARTLFREIAPRDSTGVNSMRGFRFTPDGEAYGYTFTVQLDDLYLMDRVR